jgi:hypothetical protein
MDIKKIENYLYYNWLKIAAIVFIVIFLAITLMQCSQRHETDLGIMYVGKEVVSQKLPGLAEEIRNAGITSDADGDGEITINTKAIVIPLSKEKMIEQQVPEQIQVEIISGENLFYILGKETLISYAVDESFADLTELSEKYDIPSEKCLAYEDGRIYAIPADGHPVFYELGIETEGMYFALRNYLEKDSESPKNLNAKKTLEYILGRKN